ncbi:MAG: hypothetical protein JO297_07375 [Nitrososphaeraceae archaeon]|nr:hypothetical protein [Nitrososphaeraceae archaeon]
MSRHPNWYQIKVALEQLGFIQIGDYSNQILYLRDSRGRTIGIEKSNLAEQEEIMNTFQIIYPRRKLTASQGSNNN